MSRNLHLLAIISLAIVAVMNFISTVQKPIGGSLEHAFHVLFSLALWCFLLWKI